MFNKKTWIITIKNKIECVEKLEENELLTTFRTKKENLKYIGNVVNCFIMKNNFNILNDNIHTNKYLSKNYTTITYNVFKQNSAVYLNFENKLNTLSILFSC